MIRNYFSIAMRNLRKNPLYAFINIFSLAIGLAASLVIYLFIKDERSFDTFHTKIDNIYRLDEIQNFPGTNLQKVALSMPGIALLTISYHTVKTARQNPVNSLRYE